MAFSKDTELAGIPDELSKVRRALAAAVHRFGRQLRRQVTRQSAARRRAASSTSRPTALHPRRPVSRPQPRPHRLPHTTIAGERPLTKEQRALAQAVEGDAARIAAALQDRLLALRDRLATVNPGGRRR